MLSPDGLSLDDFESAESLLELVFQAIENGDFREAIAIAQDACDLDPENDLAWYTLSLAYCKILDKDFCFQEAFKAIEKAIFIRKKSEAFHLKGYILYQWGLNQDREGISSRYSFFMSAQAYKMALAFNLEPEAADYFSVAKSLFKSHLFSKAYIWLEKAQEMGQDTPDFWLHIFICKIQVNDLESISFFANRAFELLECFDPNECLLLFACFMQLKDDRAQACMRQALYLDPDCAGGIRAQIIASIATKSSNLPN